MRLLSVLSGVALTLTGGFCLAFYNNAFSSMAFIIGALMVLSGLMTAASYIISLRSVTRLPDTVLVEGLVTMIFGFAVLNDQVPDTMVAMFFGTWLTLGGSTRLSQSFAVSRYSPKDWAKIIPISGINILLGVAMLMQTFISVFNAMTLVGIAFMLNGLSQIIYAMYMRPYIPKQKEIEAMEAAQQRLDAHEAKQSQRKALRKLSKDEREAAKAAIRAQKKAEIQARRDSELAERAARRKNEKLSGTVRFTKAEEDAVKLAAAELGLLEDGTQTDGIFKDSEAAFFAAERNKVSGPVKAEEPAKDEPAAETAAEEAAVEQTAVNTQLAEVSPNVSRVVEMRDYSLEAEHTPMWRRPTEIPVPVINRPQQTEESAQPAEEPRIEAVNLEKLEEGTPEITFEPVELPDIELASSGGEGETREEFLKAIDEASELEKADQKYVPLALDDLIPDKSRTVRLKSDEDLELRLTQSFTFNWPRNEFSEAVNKEQQKQ